jgi:hypothetical protein
MNGAAYGSVIVPPGTCARSPAGLVIIKSSGKPAIERAFFMSVDLAARGAYGLLGLDIIGNHTKTDLTFTRLLSLILWCPYIRGLDH